MTSGNGIAVAVRELGVRYDVRLTPHHDEEVEAEGWP